MIYGRSFNATMNTSGTSTNTRTVTKPSQTSDGDTLLAITVGPPTSVTPPAGWVKIGGFIDGDVQSDFFKRIASSEPADYTFTWGASSAVGVLVYSFFGGYDVHIWDAAATGTDSTPQARRTEAARNCIGFNAVAWVDTATNSVSANQGGEQFDISAANTGSTTFRGLAAYLYGPPTINDIVNIGDALPGTSFTMNNAPTGAICWQILLDEKAPDDEPWSATDGDFAVDLKLDSVSLDGTGGITTPFSGDVTGRVTAFAESGENPPSETTEKLADGLTSTKWLVNTATGYVQYDFGADVTREIKRYRMTSANDAQDRDPMDWTLQGSNNGTDFTVLDTRTNEAFANRLEVKELRVTTPGEYRYYRLDITANKSSGSTTIIQLAEWRLSTHYVWEDITTFVNEEAKIRITRGLQGTSGRSDFTRAYVELNNTDGRFATRNQDGAYFGALQRNTQMRISKAYGTKSLQLQGAVRLEGTDMCGDAARCALTDAMKLESDIDVRIDLEPESWRDEQMLCGISTAVLGDEAWEFKLNNDGTLTFTWDDGSTVRAITSTDAVPQANRQAVRVTLDVDNGASGNTVTFYRASTISGLWSKIGDPVISDGPSDVQYTGGALCVGHVASRSERGIHGRVYHFELRNGIDGTLVSDVDFTAIANGSHSFDDGDNRWITTNNAVISNRHFRFHGEVPEWPLNWDTTGTWVTTSATGAGVQKRMERSNNPLSAMRRYHTKAIVDDPGAFERFATPYAYWPLEDGKNAFQLASGLPGKPAMQVYGAPVFDESDGGIFTESENLIKLNGAKFGGKVSNNPSGYADIRWIQYSPTGMADGAEVLEVYSTGSLVRFLVSYVTDNTWRVRGFDENDNGTPLWDSGSRTITTEGERMHLQLVLDESGSTVVVTMQAYDEARVSLGSWTDTFTAASLGRVHRVNVNSDGDIVNSYVGHLAVYGSDSPAFDGTQINSHHYETAGERIKRLCQEEQAEFRYVGALSDTAFMGYQTHDNPFAMMSSAAVSDGGFLIDPLDAFGIEYRTLRSLANRAAHVELSYTAGELSGELRPVEDDSYIVNDFTANRGEAGGARFQRTDGRLSINTPPDGVGPYEQSQSYSLAHEGQCVDIASWEVHKGTLDEEHFPRVELALENLRLAADAALTEAVLTLDVGHRLDVTDTPDFLPAEDIRQIVIGYEEWFDNFQHNFKLNTIPERIFELAGYDSWSNFDAHESELYQDINSTDTAIATLVEPGLKWTEDVQSMPFSVRVDGEVMRVVAPGGLINANPFFDTSVTGWSGQNSTVAHSTDYLHPHPDSVGVAKVTPDGSLGSANVLSDAGIAVTPQNNYIASAWVYSAAGYDSTQVNINWHDAGGGYLSTGVGTAQAVPAATWTYIEQEFTAPASAATGRTMAEQSNSPTAGEIFYAWAVRISEEVSAGTESWSGDSFNRADSTTALGSTDGAGIVSAWTQNAGTWGINGNQAYISAAASSIATIPGAANLELVQFEVPTWTAGDVQLVFRYTDTNNYLRFGGTLGAAALLEQVAGGVVTTIATSDDDQGLFTLAAGDTLAVRCNGSVIECFVNGVLALCVSDTTQESASRVGMRINTSIATRIDNFYLETTSATQTFAVERGTNGAAAAHRSGSSVSLLKTPYRGV
jgi:hypothetical protein